MAHRKYLASVLVFLQFLCIGTLVLLNGILADNIAGIIIQGLAAILLSYAVISMKIDNLRISPIVKETAQLRIAGPYKIIRHPMYLSVLGYSLPLGLEKLTFINISTSLLLLLVLNIKLNFEENLLQERFPEYGEYKSTTWRILPFIY